MASAFADDARSSSVMDEMAALFAPPGREARNSQKSRVELHPYFKRPGKGHNHDACDACGEGGDLICCDNCPASFHFNCHAPPLEEEDIPMGDWICLRCYHREQLRLATATANANVNLVGFKGPDPVEGEAPSNGGAVAPTPPPPAATPASKGRKAKGGKSKRQQAAAAEKAEKEKKIKIYRMKYEKYLKVKPQTNSPFDQLIAASQVMNAEQFKLPGEMESRESLPFSWKWADERQDDFDTYPKNCTSCRKTSRGIPTVGCDFCPCVYHLDCLDPPLCEIPKERWMCPNHVENFIDSNLVTSTSMTERMKLWDKHARAPIDHDAVRLEFFRKVRTGKLYNNSTVSRVEKPPDLRIKVPGYVKYHYKNPVQGMAAETLTVEPPQPAVGREKNSAQDQDPADPMEINPEQDEWLRQLVALQTGILKQQLKGLEMPEEKSKERLARLKKAREKEKQRRLNKGRKDKAKRTKRMDDAKPENLQNGRLSPEADEGKKLLNNDVILPSDEEDSVSSCSTASECSLGLDGNDQISADAQAEICDYIARQKRFQIDVDSLDPTIRDFLAMQRVQELFKSSTISKDLPESLDKNQIQARCGLIPIDNPKCREPFMIQRRCLDVGLGSKCHLDLSKVGHCNFVSPKHASIFYDQYSRVYELINYSEFGSIVDNVVYTVELPSVKKKNRQLFRMSSEITMKITDKGNDKPCDCNRSLASIAAQADHGCEVSAVLHHGSFIRFGCLQFAFSILDYQVETVDRPTDSVNDTKVSPVQDKPAESSTSDDNDHKDSK